MAETKKPVQEDLEGKSVAPEVSVDSKTSTTWKFDHEHYVLSVSEKKLQEIRGLSPAKAQRVELRKRVRAKANVKDFPEGCYEREAKELVAKALAWPLE